MILWFLAKNKPTPNILGGVYNLLNQDWIIVPLLTNWEKQSEKKAESFDKIEVGATKIEA